MENYTENMTEAALEILRLIAEGFGAPSEFYTDIFRQPHLSTLRLIQYPARPNPPDDARDGDSGKCWRYFRHTVFNVFFCYNYCCCCLFL